MPGHIGSNRMNKKCERQGKPIASITFAQFQEQLAEAVKFYNNREQPRSVTLKGKSPKEAFRAKIEASWQSHTMTKEELVPYFCKPIDKKNGTRRVLDGGKFTVDGVTYYADELANLAALGVTVLIKRPMFGDQDRLLVFWRTWAEPFAAPIRADLSAMPRPGQAARREGGKEG